jgi:hypothetical protein
LLLRLPLGGRLFRQLPLSLFRFRPGPLGSFFPGFGFGVFPGLALSLAARLRLGRFPHAALFGGAPNVLFSLQTAVRARSPALLQAKPVPDLPRVAVPD